MEMVLHRVPGKPLNIMPLADIQWIGHDGATAERTLRKEIQRGLDNNCRFVGGGDYIDLASPSNRRRLRAAGLYDTTMRSFDSTATRLVEELYADFLEETTGRWLGLVEGHHLYEFPEGDTSDMRLCRMLEAPFLGTSAIIGLAFEGFGIVNIWLHHGAGSCSTAAGQLAKLEKLAGCFEADVYIMAHYTQKPQGDLNRIYPIWTGTPHVSHRTKKLVGAGGFGRGYQVGARQGNIPRGNYVEQAAMRPVTLGAPIIRIIPRHTEKRIEGRRVRMFEPEILVES